MITEYRRHMDRRGLARSTMDRRCAYLRSFDRWVPLADATTADVESWLDARHLGPRTRYHLISHLHSFYSWAVAGGLVAHDPTERIARPRLRRLLPRPIAADDLRVALDHADARMTTWLLLGARAGLRCAEMAGLDRVDVIDGADPVMLHVVGKGDRPRVVPAHPQVERALRALPLPSSGPVFRRPHGSRWTPAQVSRAIAVFFDDIGIDATAHQLRHRFATDLYAATQDLRLTQEMLGHSSPTTTAGYAAWSPGRASAAVSDLPDAA